MKRLFLITALLLSTTAFAGTWDNSLRKIILLGKGGSGSAPSGGYSAQGSSFLASVVANSGALSGVTDQPRGTYSGWLRGSFSNAANGTRPQMMNSNIAATWNAATSGGSEGIAGFNLALDNQAGGNGSLRMNLNNITATVNALGLGAYVNPISPAVNTAWNHILMSWDMSGATPYMAAYINGVQVISGPYSQLGSAPFNVGYSYTSGSGTGCSSTCGFVLGGSPGGGDFTYADMADVWIDFSHSILTPGTNTIPLTNRRKFFNEVTNKPARINSTGNCSDPFTYQPTMCFTNDNSSFTTNLGYGGLFSVTSAPHFATPALAPANIAVSAATYPTPAVAHTVVQNWQNGGQGTVSPTVTTADSNQIAIGDLLVAIILITSNTGDPASSGIAPPTGWTALYQDYCACTASSGSYQRVGVFYKIATSTDATAYNGTTATGYTGTGAYSFSGYSGQRGVSWRLIDYLGVNQTTPIDPASAGQDNNVNVTAIALPTITTTYSNELVVGLALDYGTAYGPYTVSGTAYPRGSDYIWTQSSTRPQILQFDKQFPTAGSTSGFATVTRASSTKPSQSFVFGIIPQ